VSHNSMPAPTSVDSLAREILREASRDSHGTLTSTSSHDGYEVATNNKQWTWQEPRYAAMLKAAFEVLERKGYVQADGAPRTVFSMTNVGYEAADGH